MATTRTNGETGDIRADLDQLRADIAALASDLKGIAGRAGDEVVDGARSAARQAREKFEAATDKVSDSITERPLTSLLVAFFVGILLGKLFRR